MENAKKKVLLAGATGTIGRQVAASLLQRGYKVIAPVRADSIARAPAACDGLDIRIVERYRLPDLHRVLDGDSINSVISCIASRSGVPADARRVDLNANLALLRAAQDASAGHFVLLSAICVQKPRLAFQFAKLAFERALAASGIGYSIVRPTAYFKSLSGQVSRVLAGKAFLLFGDGTGTACKPIAGSDLADYLVGCLDDGDKRNRVLPIGGPGEPVTPLEQGELLFRLAGLPPRFREVPVGLFTAAENILSPFAMLSRIAAEKMELARIARYYATESMLVWDSVAQRYDAGATPVTGSQTLEGHYAGLLDAQHSEEAAGPQGST